MSNEIKGYIKFKDKKVITRPLDGEKGLVMTWEITESNSRKEYFTYKGIKYQLISSVENKLN